MAKNKIIFGIGNIPKASDFSIGELVINVNDQKVFSKDKQNVVFEIQGSSSTPPPTDINTGSFYLSSSLNNNIITFNQGDGTTDTIDLNNLTSQDNDWYIDIPNSRLTSSLDVFVEGNITASIISSSLLKLKDYGGSLPSAEGGALAYSNSNFFVGLD